MGRTLRRDVDVSEDPLRHLIDEGWRAETEGIGAAFMLSYLPEGPLEAIMDSVRVLQNSVDKKVFLAIRDSVNEIDNRDVLPKVTCPVLVVHARMDSIHPLSEGRRLAAGLPNAELWIQDTANDLPIYGHKLWDDYVRGVKRFLSE